MDFDALDVLRLEVQQGWPDLVNIIPNPNGTAGAWGWVTTPGASLEASPTGLLFTGETTGGAVVLSDAAGVPEVTGPGPQAKLWWSYVSGTTGVFANIVALDATGSVIGTSPNVSAQSTPGDYSVSAWTVPVGTVAVAARFSLSGATAGRNATLGGVVMVFGDPAEVAASSPLDEPGWTNILGPTHKVTTGRDELDVGTLTALVLDAAYDPSASELIRKGKRVRVRVLVGGEWENLFSGLIDNATVEYVLKDPALAASKRTRITLTATDPAASLANVGRSNGVGTIAELPAVLLGTGVPWNVNGSTDAIDPDDTVVVAVNENASALDQVAITRDSVLGYAWVDRNGVLHAWDAATFTYPIPDAGFETPASLEFWTGTGGALTRVAGGGRAGTYALRQSEGGFGEIYAISPTGTAGFPVFPGRTYVANAWSAKATTGGARQTRIGIRWYNAGGSSISDSDGTAVTETIAFGIRTVSAVAPAGAAFAAVRLITLGATSSALERHQWDDVMFGQDPATLDEDDYSDLGLDFDLSRCINTVVVKVLQINAGTGETEEVSFGPFVDSDSIRQYGRRQAEFTIQGAGFDLAAIEAYAAAVLSANAIPIRRVTSVVLPIRTIAELEAKALLDLYDLMQVANQRGSVQQLLRITSVGHEITARNSRGGWSMTVGFSTDGSVAPPQVTPSPGVGNGKTIGQLLRPVGEVTMWFGAEADIPAGWLSCDGSSFDGDQYPELATLLGGTVLPNFEDRFPIGAGAKALGSSGGSATANVAAHTHGAGTLAATAPAAATEWSTPNTGSNQVPRAPSFNNHTHSITGASGSSGGQTVDVLNPWRAIWFIIRAA